MAAMGIVAVGGDQLYPIISSPDRTPPRIVAPLLCDIVTAAGFDAAGLGHAHTQIVVARSRRWRRFLTAHAADSGGTAVLATLASHRSRFFR